MIVPCVNCQNTLAQVDIDTLHCSTCGFSFCLDDTQVQHENELEYGWLLAANQLVAEKFRDPLTTLELN